MAKPIASTTSNTWPSLIFQLYLAGVCGFSLIVATFSAGSLLTNGLDLAIPQPVSISTTQWDEGTKTQQPRPAEAIAQERDQEAARQLIYAKREMAHSTIYLLLAGLIFGFHWRLFKARKE